MMWALSFALYPTNPPISRRKSLSPSKQASSPEWNTIVFVFFPKESRTEWFPDPFRWAGVRKDPPTIRAAILRAILGFVISRRIFAKDFGSRMKGRPRTLNESSGLEMDNEPQFFSSYQEITAASFMNNQKVVHLRVLWVWTGSLDVVCAAIPLLSINASIYCCSSISFSPNILNEQLMNIVIR